MSIHRLAMVEAHISRAQSLEHYRKEFLEIAISKYKMARNTPMREQVIEHLAEWVGRLST